MEDYPTEIIWNGNTYRRYPNSKDKAKVRYYVKTTGKGYKTLHREKWEYYNGQIPKGHHIHHKDGDYFNNDIENLECLSPLEHAQEHKEEFYESRVKHMDNIRKLASEWHGSEEGLEFHKKLGKMSWEGREPQYERTCCVCDTEFSSFNINAKYCSKKCQNYDYDKKYRVEVDCPVCGEAFMQNKYKSKPMTCSGLCGAAYRKVRGL